MKKKKKLQKKVTAEYSQGAAEMPPWNLGIFTLFVPFPGFITVWNGDFLSGDEDDDDEE